jgi:hypothetical protein
MYGSRFLLLYQFENMARVTSLGALQRDPALPYRPPTPANENSGHPDDSQAARPTHMKEPDLVDANSETLWTLCADTTSAEDVALSHPEASSESCETNMDTGFAGAVQNDPFHFDWPFW